jgi:SAM-dependent methyltransferase
VAQFHFVEDYERLVADLLAVHPRDEAMAMAVGGSFEQVGRKEVEILAERGVRDGVSVLDLGCGSGRLAIALAASYRLNYVGTDIVQALLDYADEKTPEDYRFILHRDLSVPVPNASIDVACAFSVFTHLLHSESYLYLEDIRRALKPGGVVVFSFLEFGDQSEPDRDRHWQPFEALVDQQRLLGDATRMHLNLLIERNAIAAWARHLDYELLEINAHTGLGQTVAVLRKPDGGNGDAE